MGKPWHKRWYVWVVGFVVLSCLAAPFASKKPNVDSVSSSGSESTTNIMTTAEATTTTVEATTTSATTTTAEATTTTTEATTTTVEATTTSETTTTAVATTTASVSGGRIQAQDNYTFRRNNDATISIIGKPNTEYSIAVYYKSGKSDAEGLENKISDSNGNVSWTWHIGGRTTEGTYKVIFKGGGEETTKEITILVE